MNILGINGQPDRNATNLTNLQSEKLKQDLKTLLPGEFISKWVEFDFKDQEAKDVSWEIIYDYFHIKKNGMIRNFSAKIINDQNENKYVFPQGQIVALQFKLSDDKIYGRLCFSKRVLTKVIDLSKISRIKGSLTALEITIEREILILADNIEMIPN